MKGFYNRILKIDLTHHSDRIEPIPDHVLERFLGGKGLATHLLLEHNPPGVHPMSPENRRPGI